MSRGWMLVLVSLLSCTSVIALRKNVTWARESERDVELPWVIGRPVA